MSLASTCSRLLPWAVILGRNKQWREREGRKKKKIEELRVFCERKKVSGLHKIKDDHLHT
jgi:hypothetical protein